MAKCTICGSEISEQNEKRGNVDCMGCKDSKRVLKNGLASRNSRVKRVAKHLDAIPEEVVHALISNSKL